MPKLAVGVKPHDLGTAPVRDDESPIRQPDDAPGAMQCSPWRSPATDIRERLRIDRPGRFSRPR
jgi:hypothetical protein